MAYEDDYASQLNLGSKSALQSAAPQPAEAPPGFGGQGATGPVAGVSTGLSASPTSTMPSPPKGYMPGPLSMPRHNYEDSTLYKIGSVLASYGETVPVNLKIRLAQQEADFKVQEQKLAWDNYYKSNEVARNLSQQQNREAQKEFLALLPNMKAQITSMYGTPPEEQAKYLGHLKNIAESLHPGGADMLDFFYKNQGTVYAGDALLSHPDKGIAQQAQQMAALMGYDNWIKSKEHEQLADQVNRDWVTTSAARLPFDMQKKLADKTLDEDTFRTSIKDAGYAKGMRPVEVTSMLAFLESTNGQNMMLNIGIVPSSLKMALAKKEKPSDFMSADKKADYEKTKAIVDFAAEHPGVVPADTVKEAQLRMDRYLGVAAKESSAGQFSENNPLGASLMSVSKSEFSDPREMMKGIVPGTPEHTRRQRLLDAALEKNAQLRPMAGNEAKLAMLHDTNAKPVFRLSPKGELERVEGPVTEREYLSGKDTFSMTPDQRTKLSELTQTTANGKALFDEASKAYKATDIKGRVAEFAAENATTGWLSKIPGASAVAASTHPDLFNYVSRRDSALGKFARSLGGEVGVLTDQDIARVVKMFPNASDTTRTRQAKERAFNQLVALNRRALFTTLKNKKGLDTEGSVTPEELAALKEENKPAVNGILGSVEDLARRDAAEVERASSGSTARSLAEPSDMTGKGTRAESLLDRMRKGQ